jgi:hypothetical protein
MACLSEEERQLDITLLVDQYQQILLSLSAKPEVSLATLIEGISLLTRTLQVPCKRNGTGTGTAPVNSTVPHINLVLLI